ncbi:hypothetical protein [Rhizobium sp. BR 314]|uniref:hypothetical protein n=1 Tax=Rhizobium sp. BR 314 TaxID=3040013 RepID=UPI0039BFA5C0
MRRGIGGLSALVEAIIKEAPGRGAIFGFRGNAPTELSFYAGLAQRFCSSRSGMVSLVGADHGSGCVADTRENRRPTENLPKHASW